MSELSTDAIVRCFHGAPVKWQKRGQAELKALVDEIKQLRNYYCAIEAKQGDKQ